MLRYGLPAATHVRLEVFDDMRRRVVLPADEVLFDGSRLPAGVYVACLHSGSEVRTERVTVVR